LAAAPPPPRPADELPRAQERLAVAALALAAFSLNLNTNVLGALLPFLPQELGLGERGAGYLLAAAALGSACGALGTGPLAARVGRRPALVGGLALFVVASLGHLLAGSLWQLVVLRALAGLAVGLAYAAASALAAEIAPYARRGAAMGWFTAGMFLAIPVGMPLSVLLAKAGHWRGIFAVQAALAALGVAIALRAVPVRAAPERPGLPFDLLARAPVRAVLAATMLHVGSFFTTVQLAAAWLDATGVVPKAHHVHLWVGLGLLSCLGSASFGRLCDRTGKRRFVLACSLPLALCFVVLAAGPAPAWLLPVGALLCLLAAARTGPLQALLSGLAPPDRLGALMGVRGAVMQLGVVAFALASGPIAAALQFPGVLLLAAGCQLASLLLVRRWGAEGR